MNTQRAADVLRRLTRSERSHMAKSYFPVHVAWLQCQEHERAHRLASIQSAARGEPRAAAELAKVTEAWEARYGKRTRFAGILKSHIDTIGNGVHEVWGDRRNAWSRFAGYVALRAVVSHKSYGAMRASYRQIAALSLGFPTVAAAIDAGHDLTANHGMYRRTQRTVKAIVAAGLVLSWKQSGYRTLWYSLRLATPDVPKAIAREQAATKRNLRLVRELIADVTEAAPRIEPSQAAAIYTDVRALGWHDAELIALPREAYAHAVTATEFIGGRRYVRLTRCNATEYQRAKAGLHNAVGRHVLRRYGT